MYSSLMGTFDIPVPINYLGSTCIGNSVETVVDRTDPWALPFCYEPNVHLSTVEVSYQAIVDTTFDPISTPSTVSEELEETYLPSWEENSLYSGDYLDMVLPSDEANLEAMNRRDNIYEYFPIHPIFFQIQVELKTRSST